MSANEILDYTTGKIRLQTIPDLTRLGYTSEASYNKTPHVIQTDQRLSQLETKVVALEARPGGVSQADFLNLLQTVNSQSQLIDQLTARLAYAEGYLKMIDEAIAVEDFPGWTPPVFD
jgi:hypothetical protein